ncbi:MAG: Bug family tripartite tricarboxylate transporter substrate binding protein [Burkholderiales bacterium]
MLIKGLSGLFFVIFGSLTISGSVQAQSPAAAYPVKPVRFILPYAAGGMPDTVARALSQDLSGRLGQSVVIDNRPGAAQAIALEAAAKAPSDGYTMVMGTMAGLLFLTASRKSLPYDPFKDLASVTLLMHTPFFISIHNSLPANSIQEFMALVKAQPGKYFYGTLGVGSGHHLVTELFKTRTGTNFVHVPFKGGIQAHADLIAGQVQIMFEGPGLMNHVKSGKVRVLAATSMKRAAVMPDVPTLNETVLPGFDVGTWFGVSVPAAVPRPIVEKLNRELVTVLRSQAQLDRFAAQGLEGLASTPEEMSERIRVEYPIWTKVMRAAGIEPE